MGLIVPLMFLIKLSYAMRFRVPLFIIFLCFILDIRMQLNVTVQRIEIPQHPAPREEDN